MLVVNLTTIAKDDIQTTMVHGRFYKLSKNIIANRVVLVINDSIMTRDDIQTIMIHRFHKLYNIIIANTVPERYKTVL